MRFKGFCERYRIDPKHRRAKTWPFCKPRTKLGPPSGIPPRARRIVERCGRAFHGRPADRASPLMKRIHRFGPITPKVAGRDLRRTAGGGPSTGMPTRTPAVGHHDLRLRRRTAIRGHVLLFPAKSRRMLLHWRLQAFRSFAERPADSGLRALRSRLSAMKRLDVPGSSVGTTALPAGTEARFSRPKKLRRSSKSVYRYVDRDDDAITYRTLPGKPAPRGGVFHARARVTTNYGRVYRGFDPSTRSCSNRLKRKIRRKTRPKYFAQGPWITAMGGNDVGIVSLGSCDGAKFREALDVLRRSRKIDVDYLRVKAVSVQTTTVETFFEIAFDPFSWSSRTAMRSSNPFLTLETAVEESRSCSPFLSYSGFPMSAEPIVKWLSEQSSPRRRG